MILAKAQRAPRRRIKKVFFAVLAAWRDKKEELDKIILAQRRKGRQARRSTKTLCGLGVPSAEFILTKEGLRTGLARKTLLKSFC